MRTNAEVEAKHISVVEQLRNEAQSTELTLRQTISSQETEMQDLVSTNKQFMEGSIRFHSIFAFILT